MNKVKNTIFSELIRSPIQIGEEDADAPRVILAMPTGEVHDIGKTVIAGLFAANRCHVIDLGTVSTETVVLDAIQSQQADMVGISCMLTSSLEQLQKLAEKLSEAKCTVPLLLGGPGITPLMVAQHIAPRYTTGSTMYVKDVQECEQMCKALRDPKLMEQIASDAQSQQSDLRATAFKQIENKTLLSLDEAREKRLNIDWSQYEAMKPKKLGVQVLENIDLNEVSEWVDWTTIFLAFGMKGKYPNILNDIRFGPAAQSVDRDAKNMLKRIVGENLLQARAVIGFFEAKSQGDDIHIFDAGKPVGTLNCLRQQAVHSADKPYYALADFIAPKSADKTDYIGAFTLSCGFGVEELEREFASKNDYYHRILVKSLADCLAEAFAEYLHRQVRTDYWGYVPDENLSLDQVFRCEFQGIRPAPGYPACPEHSEKELLFRLLDAQKHIKMDLTSSYAMWPAASVCGFYFSHPQAKYYWLGSIGRDQVEDYARRANRSVAWVEQQLQMNLNYINK